MLLETCTTLSDEEIAAKLPPFLQVKKNVTTEDTLMDLVRNCFPDNIIRATMQQYRTHLIYPEVDNVR